MDLIKYNIALLLSPKSVEQVVKLADKIGSSYDLSYSAQSDRNSDLYPHISVYKFLSTREIKEQIIHTLKIIGEIPSKAVSNNLGASKRKGYIYYRLEHKGLIEFHQKVIEALKFVSKEPLERYREYKTDDPNALNYYKEYLSYEVLDWWNPHITIGRLANENLVDEVLTNYSTEKKEFEIVCVQLYAEGIGTLYLS